MDDFFVNDARCSTSDDYFFFEKKVYHSLLQKKRYCRKDEVCAICLEMCFFQKNTWITACGHVFHKTCLKNYYQFDAKDKTCPTCRGNAGNMEFLDGMRFQVGLSTTNKLDLLDEIDSLIPKSCENNDHFLGMKKECNVCCEYRMPSRTVVTI